MDIRRLGLGVAVAGLAGAALCCIWWAAFYSEVIRYVGTRNDALDQFLGCLVIDDFRCGTVKNLAKFAGYTPYEPLFFWLSGVFVVIGSLLRYSTHTE